MIVTCFRCFVFPPQGVRFTTTTVISTRKRVLCLLSEGEEMIRLAFMSSGVIFAVREGAIYVYRRQFG